MAQEQKKFTPNAKQQECIDNLEGAYLVLAGPGTGKTFTLTQRVKAIIDKGVAPEKILCLTFTEVGANEMYKRVEPYLKVGQGRPAIHTFHGFCTRLLSEHQSAFDLPKKYTVVNNTIKKHLMIECIKERTPEILKTEKNDPYYYISAMLEAIDEIKQRRMSEAEFLHNIQTNPDWEPALNGKGRAEAEKNIAKAKELWLYYQLYQEKLRQNHCVDFNDMIALVLNKFETDDAFLNEVANKYDYLLVDEYQDTNHAQNDLVFHLVRAIETHNVFVVGDDDQIICTFQGARLDTMENFLTAFPETKVICLKENMRSTPTILQEARALICKDSKRLEMNPEFKKYDIDKQLVAKNKDVIALDKPVERRVYANDEQEAFDILSEIEALIASDDCPKDEFGNKNLSEIAILAATNDELAQWAELFKHRNIPYELKEGENVFAIPAVRMMMSYMKMLVNPYKYSAQVFQVMLSEPFVMNGADYCLIERMKGNYESFWDSIRAISPQKFVNPEKIAELIKTYDYLFASKSALNAKNLVLEIGNLTGIFKYYLNLETNRQESVGGLKKLVDEAAAFSEFYQDSGFEAFVEYLCALAQDGKALLTDKAPLSENAVQLRTYHGAKGREFAYVYLPSLLAKRWENKGEKGGVKIVVPKSAEEDAYNEEMKISDKIKLLYVGMTRARHCLRLSYACGKEAQPTCLVFGEQAGELRQSQYSNETYWQQASASLCCRRYDYRRDFCSLIDKMLKNRAFSSTLINCYLECPRKFLYNYILGASNFSEESPDTLSYGLAIHEVCDRATKYALENKKYPTLEQMIEDFDEVLYGVAFSDVQHKDISRGRGVKALENFYPYFTNVPIENIFASEQGVLSELEGVKFTGKIDRIDINEDGTYTIIDYKTGKKRKANEVCSGGAKEGYYNQLALYKYFFEKTTGFEVRETKLIFPEAPKDDLIVTFGETQEKEVIDKVVGAIKAIGNYEFEPIDKAEREGSACKYCAFAAFCDRDIV